MELVCLHENAHLMEGTIDLLNSQWPRSRNARFRSLEQSSKDRFPVSLLLITKTDGKEVIVGHCKVVPVPYTASTCFVESVLIALPYRGKGYGRLIMEKTEDFVKRKGVSRIYLTTHDQQKFYLALGYEFCDPVMVVGGGSAAFLQRMKNFQASIFGVTLPEKSTCEDKSVSKHDRIQSPKIQASSVDNIPPPPPSVPLKPITISSPGSNTNTKFYMRKTLC